MRILNINNHAALRGGSERYFHELGRLLERHGHRVTPFAAGVPPAPPVLATGRPRLRDLPRPFYSPQAARAVRGLLARNTHDLAHLHIYYGQLTAGILRPLRDAGVPLVQTLHEYKLVCPAGHLHRRDAICGGCGIGNWRAVAYRCNRHSLVRSLAGGVEAGLSRALGSLRHIDRFVAVSEFVRRAVVARGVPAQRVVTVPNFVDPERFRGARATEGYVLYFGRLEMVKGMAVLLDAARRLPNVPFVVAGDGGARPQLEQAAQRLPNLRLLPFRHGPALHRLIAGSLCTVLPSIWHEPFGLTLLEGFALGRPAVASRIGGIPEVVSDRADGLLVPPGDGAALASALAWMHHHRAAADAMGRAGRRKTEREFSPARHYAALSAVYGELRGGSGG